MARAEDLLFAPTQWYVVATAVNGNAVATMPARAKARHYIVGVDISASAAPAATVSATLKDGAATMMQLEIPAAAFAPLMHNYMRPWEGSTNSDAVLTLPALGAGVRGTVVLRGFTQLA